MSLTNQTADLTDDARRQLFNQAVTVDLMTVTAAGWQSQWSQCRNKATLSYHL